MYTKLLGVLALSLMTHDTIPQQDKPTPVSKDAATVEQMEGFYIFCDSKPSRPYTYLGTIRNGVGLQVQYQSVRNRLLKNARKSYQSADGLIMRFNNMGFDKADVIKFE